MGNNDYLYCMRRFYIIPASVIDLNFEGQSEKGYCSADGMGVVSYDGNALQLAELINKIIPSSDKKSLINTTQSYNDGMNHC